MKTLAQLCDDGMVQAKIEKKSIILLFFYIFVWKKEKKLSKNSTYTLFYKTILWWQNILKGETI